MGLAAFRWLWIGILFSNMGIWMQTVGAQWLLVDTPNAAALVSLVQAANALPVMLLAFPAGVVAGDERAASGSPEARPARGETVKVAGIVLKWVRGDKEANYARAEPMIREAAARGAEIVCTPADGWIVSPSVVSAMVRPDCTEMPPRADELPTVMSTLSTSSKSPAAPVTV